MRYSQKFGRVHVVLSRRNLLSLLHKLDVQGSSRTLVFEALTVSSEDDAVHYQDREVPGRMSDATEKFIAGYERKRHGLAPLPDLHLNSHKD